MDWRARASGLRIGGHRGDPESAPENTFAAFEAAVAAGVDFIETDIQRTADGVLVLFHDDTLERTTTGRGRVADVTAAELCALDTGSWFAPRFGDQRVPFLDAFLDWLDRHPDLGAELDIKANGIGGELAERIAHCAALRMCGVRRRLNVEHNVTRAAARLLPHLTAAPSCDSHDPGG